MSCKRGCIGFFHVRLREGVALYRYHLILNTPGTPHINYVPPCKRSVMGILSIREYGLFNTSEEVISRGPSSVVLSAYLIGSKNAYT